MAPVLIRAQNQLEPGSHELFSIHNTFFDYEVGLSGKTHNFEPCYISFYRGGGGQGRLRRLWANVYAELVSELLLYVIVDSIYHVYEQYG